MKELLRQWRGRRENPVYRQWGMSRRWMRGGRGYAWMALALWYLWKGDANGFIPYMLLSGITFALSLPLCFMWFAPGFGRQELEELSVTQLSSAEIAYGIILPPVVMALWPLVLLHAGGLLLVVLNPYHQGSWRWLLDLLLFGAVGTAFFLLVLSICVRQQLARPGETTRNIIFSAARSALAFVLLYSLFFVIMITINIGALAAPGEMLLLGTVGAFVMSLVAVEATRYTLRHLPSRLSSSNDGEIRPLLWSMNRLPTEGEEERRRQSVLQLWKAVLRSWATADAFAVVAAMMIAVGAFVLWTSSAVHVEWRTPLRIRGIFSGHVIFAVMLLGTVAYAAALQRRFAGTLPVVPGRLLHTLAAYSLLPVLFGWLMLLAGELLIRSQGPAIKNSETYVFFLLLLLMAVLMAAVMLSILRGGWRASFPWILAAGCLLWSGWSVYDHALDFPEIFRFTWQTLIEERYGLHNVPLFTLLAFGFYLLLVGFATRLQRLHEERVSCEENSAREIPSR